MRVIVIGTVIFSRHMLEELIGMGVVVAGVCTAQSVHLNSDYTDLGPLCKQHGIALLRTDDINAKATLDWIRARQPDVVLCLGWSRLIGRELLGLTPLGVIGYHPAALPSNRGRHPLIWALVLGLESTASTFFQMDEGADSGDILSQSQITIQPEDDASSLYFKVVDAARRQLAELIPALAAGRTERRVQDVTRANTWRKRRTADGCIDWRMPAHGIYNMVRALGRPYPGADFVHAGTQFKVWKAEVVTDVPANAEPGKVLAHREGKPVIRCGDHAIVLLESNPPFIPAVGVYL